MTSTRRLQHEDHHVHHVFLSYGQIPNNTKNTPTHPLVRDSLVAFGVYVHFNEHDPSFSVYASYKSMQCTMGIMRL